MLRVGDHYNRGINEPALGGVGRAADQDRRIGVAVSPPEVTGVLDERPLVDDGSHVVAHGTDVSDRQLAGHGAQSLLDLRLTRGRSVDPAGRRALLTLVAEATRDHRRDEGHQVEAGVSDDEVLPASLPDDPGIREVPPEVASDALVEAVEGGRAAREVQARQSLVLEGHRRHLWTVARDEVDDTRRETGPPHDLEQVPGGQGGFEARLPERHVPHKRRSAGQVGRDGGEVEGRDRVDEALERAPVGHVPDRTGLHRGLLVDHLAGVVNVEAPEVNQFANRVDLGLVGVLALAEHGDRVDDVAGRSRQVLGGGEEHTRAQMLGQFGPLRLGVQRGLDGTGHEGSIGQVDMGEHEFVIAGIAQLPDVAGEDLLVTDDAGDVDDLAGLAIELRFQSSTICRTRGVRTNRFIERNRTSGIAVHGDLLGLEYMHTKWHGLLGL